MVERKKKTSIVWWFLLAIVFWFALCHSKAGATEPMKIGVSGEAPFVIENTKGVAPELWREVAIEANINYTLVPYDNVQSMVDDVHSGKLDGAIGPISVTADRASKNIEFSQPFFESGTGVLTADNSGVWNKIKPFLTANFWYGLLGFIGLLHVVGIVFWFIERKKNPEHFNPTWKGIFGGAWFAIVTMTTVGYGDKSPITVPGRVMAACWMLITALMFSSFTAFLTTALVTGSQDPAELKGKRVAAVEGTTGARIAHLQKAKLRTENSLEGALEALTSGKVEAVVFDAPALQHWLRSHPDSGMVVAPSIGTTEEHYAFVTSDEECHDINIAILHLRENGKLQEIKDRWLSEI